MHSEKCLPPTKSALDNFFQKLSLSETKPAILSIVPPYSAKYESKSLQKIYPLVLSELYTPTAIEKNYLEVLQFSKKVALAMKTDKKEQESVEVQEE